MEKEAVLDWSGSLTERSETERKLGVTTLKDDILSWVQGIKYDESKSLESQDDEVLVYLYNNGSSAAFEVLYQRHRSSLYNFIMRFVQDPATAEDIFQEVFIRIINSSSKFRMKSKFTTWAYTIARNLCIDHIRKWKRTDSKHIQSSPCDEDTREPLIERIPSYSLSPEDKTSSMEVKSLIDEALNRLNPDQREVFLMREEMGMQFEEIAQVCKCSVGTVKSRMRYALENMRRFLKTKNLTAIG
jgi:RNA polymerase sigma-70 factor, ECF subfamily